MCHLSNSKSICPPKPNTKNIQHQSMDRIRIGRRKEHYFLKSSARLGYNNLAQLSLGIMAQQ